MRADAFKSIANSLDADCKQCACLPLMARVSAYWSFHPTATLSLFLLLYPLVFVVFLNQHIFDVSELNAVKVIIL